MNRFVLIGAVLAAAPPATRAALDLQIGPNQGADAVDAVVAPGSGEHFFDLTFDEMGPAANELLNGFDLLVRAQQPGINLVRIDRPDNWVFTDPTATLATADMAADHIEATGFSGFSGAGVDVNTGEDAARVFYTVDPAAPPGLYRITLDPNGTVFASSDPNVDHGPVVDTTDPGVVLVTPEPSGLAALAFGGLLALRRRRSAFAHS